MSGHRHMAIVGPTAVGKSEVAMQIARQEGDVEIVSLDSMQVYRGLDIGTAKPSQREREEVRHHLVDVEEPTNDWSVVQTQRAAHAAIADIEARGRRALLVGGTGLYVQAVVDGLEFPGENLEVRARLEAQTSAPGGVRDAYEKLRRLDPRAADRIDEHNQRRIVRALEVIEVTGREFSSFGPGVFEVEATVVDAELIGMWLPRAVLNGRIEARADAMRVAGMVDEVRALATVELSRTASQAIGYREVLEHLVTENLNEQQLFASIARRTKSFARRQRMWFRRDPRITWFGGSGMRSEIADSIRRRWNGAVAGAVAAR